ncbi:hypothetical protein D7X96_05150 [Corallococcus interemptor]|uniref:Glycosyltransferase RgtA/B/C/D-like domain-containing protein n=1 Tax=Corallococcus interemptor TaxID=2316720 RepID=A0A3A8QUN5_9BACT|nr:hypothetical protein [Corallococcus interemptor]RKH72469.1 hypothetical protein D7X96_05150 [Corallococcus interemptor]
MKRGPAEVLALLGWALSLALALVLLRPGMESGPSYSSDTAIPLLMARAARVDLFHAYYLGQDRFGAWPFLLARLVGGRNWSPGGLQTALIIVSWSAAFPLARLVRASGAAAGMLVAVPLALAGPAEVRTHVLDGAQPYGWQFAMLAWTWLGLRRLLEARSRPSRWGWGVAAAVTAALACWVSTSSLPVLAVIWGVELPRAWLRGLEGWRPWVMAAVPITVGGVFERQLRRLYHRFANRTYGQEYRTSVGLDRGHLWDNAGRVLGSLWSGPLPLGGLLLVGFLLAGRWLVRHARRGRAAWAELPDPAWMAIACGISALGQLALLVTVAHVRNNDFAARYFALAHLLLLVGLGALLLHQLAAWLPPRVSRIAGALGVAAAGVALVWAWTHPSRPREDHARALEAARTLARVAPGTLLMGGYWDVFHLAALQPLETQAMPLPDPRHYQRSPFNLVEVGRARALVWVRSDGDREPEEPQQRELHAVRFLRETEPLARVPGYTFWRYVRAPAAR